MYRVIVVVRQPRADSAPHRLARRHEGENSQSSGIRAHSGFDRAVDPTLVLSVNGCRLSAGTRDTLCLILRPTPLIWSRVRVLVCPQIVSTGLDVLWLLATFGEVCLLTVSGVYLWKIE